MSRESINQTGDDFMDDPAGDEIYFRAEDEQAHWEEDPEYLALYFPPPVVDSDGAPLYRQGQGPGDPVRCDND